MNDENYCNDCGNYCPMCGMCSLHGIEVKPDSSACNQFKEDSFMKEILSNEETD